MATPTTRTLLDYQRRAVRLTAERLAHIGEHPEMRGLVDAIGVALAAPDRVVESRTDSAVRLYYVSLRVPSIRNRYLCVVAKVSVSDAFVITAYITDSVKQGRLIWPIAN